MCLQRLAKRSAPEIIMLEGGAYIAGRGELSYSCKVSGKTAQQIAVATAVSRGLLDLRIEAISRGGVNLVILLRTN